MLHITYYISCPAHQTRYRLFINLENRHQTLQLNWFFPDLTFAKFLGWLSKAVTNRSFADSTNCFHLFPTGTFFSKEFLLQTYSNFNRHYPELLPGRPRFPLSRSPVYRTAQPWVRTGRSENAITERTDTRRTYNSVVAPGVHVDCCTLSSFSSQRFQSVFPSLPIWYHSARFD